ncbi:MAG: Crp/Fnr family transcriptional regulator [Clostridium sp.]
MNKHVSHNCEKCHHKLCVEKVPIFSGLNSEELSKVANLIVKRKYEKGELIIMEENPLENLIIIDNGKVKVFCYTIEGKEQILYILDQGDFFGEKNLLNNQNSTYNVEALETTHICMINKNDFQKLLITYPTISIKIIEELCTRMDKIENSIQNIGAKNIEWRINSLLIEFAERYGKATPKGIIVELPLSREGMANYIGTARETVSRKLSLLQDKGIINMIGNKQILILDINALKH